MRNNTDWIVQLCAICAEDYEVLEEEAHWRNMCTRCFIRSKNRERVRAAHDAFEEWDARRTNTSNLPPLNELLQLCHPDKHDGSLLANKVTQQLLKLRSQS